MLPMIGTKPMATVATSSSAAIATQTPAALTNNCQPSPSHCRPRPMSTARPAGSKPPSTVTPRPEPLYVIGIPSEGVDHPARYAQAGVGDVAADKVAAALLVDQVIGRAAVGRRHLHHVEPVIDAEFLDAVLAALGDGDLRLEALLGGHA